MCWSKEVSFLTLVAGTFFNYHLWHFPSPMARPIAMVWQFVLGMQFFEGVSWVSKDVRSSVLSTLATRGAFVFNVAQPLVAAWLLGAQAPLRVRATLGVLCVIYAGLVVRGTLNRPFRDLYTATCQHLTLYWWNWFPSALPLFNLIFLISFSCIFPRKLALFLMAYGALALYISSKLYTCSYGSMWCWLVAFAPVATLLFLRFT